jgi:Uma2 family endonuclease
MNMSLMPALPTPTWTIQRLRRHFGMIPAERILLDPPPGTATEKDAYRANEIEGRLCELVDGVLVEKTMGEEESGLEMWLGYILFKYLVKHNLGKLLGPDGFLRLMPGLLRAPDLSFITWARYPRNPPPYPRVAPDLAVEVISPGNTRQEIARKRREYFACGGRLVWEIDPRKRTVTVYTSPKKYKVLGVKDTLNGGEVLPGFKLRVAKQFSPPGPPLGR